LIGGSYKLILKRKDATSVTRNGEGPLRRAVTVEEATRDLSLLFSAVDEYYHVLSSTADNNRNEAVLA
jgi:hypothetical protein